MRANAPLMVGNGHAPPPRRPQGMIRQKETKIEEYTQADGSKMTKKTSLTMEKSVDHGGQDDELNEIHHTSNFAGH